MNFATCPQCGTRFPQAVPHQVFCTEPCYRADFNARRRKMRRKARPRTRTCPCGQTFVTASRSRKYCSPQCRGQYWYQAVRKSRYFMERGDRELTPKEVAEVERRKRIAHECKRRNGPDYFVQRKDLEVA